MYSINIQVYEAKYLAKETSRFSPGFSPVLPVDILDGYALLLPVSSVDAIIINEYRLNT